MPEAQRGIAEQCEAPAGRDLRRWLVARVFVQFRRSLLAYLRRLLARRKDAEDLPHETYLKLVDGA